MASFEKVNYALRPNKNIERKLMVEVLRRLEARFDLRNYRYIGLGSLWFVDFRLMHRTFQIVDMISIEKYRAERAEFNRPLACVTVEDGDTTMVLPRLDLREKRSIIWLDHDKDLRGPALEDLAFLAERVPSGSIIAVTVNAHHAQLKGRKDEAGDEVSREEALRQYVGDLVPDPLSPDALNRNGFQVTVSRIIRAAIQHALARSGREESFRLLFNFAYQDGAPMVTVGGMIATSEDQERLSQTDVGDLDFVAEAYDYPFPIDAPLLTLKEKTTLDSCLPREEGLPPDLIRREYALPLNAPEIEGYSRFYRYYPVFGELLL